MLAESPFLIKERNQQLNYMRLIFSGKSDYLLSKKKIMLENPKLDNRFWINMNAVNKTSGWVSKWLEYYFLVTVKRIESDGYEDADNFQQFRKWIEKGDHRERIRKRVEIDFKELYTLLCKLEMTM